MHETQERPALFLFLPKSVFPSNVSVLKRFSPTWLIKLKVPRCFPNLEKVLSQMARTLHSKAAQPIGRGQENVSSPSKGILISWKEISKESERNI
ncbi:hypothetical protein FSB08_00215 [Paraburkholderia sp. JPY432]|nr:hypothetical protein [Paraburkholderia youngii]